MRLTWVHAHAHGHAQVGRLAVVVHVECAYLQTDVGAGDLASDGRALSLLCVATLRRNCYSKTVSKCPIGLAVQGEDANGIELKDPAYAEKENCRKVFLNACGSG